jgi:hypothetical protein
MQHQMGNAVLFKHSRNKFRPFVKPAAKITCRQPPKQPIAEIEVDAVDPVPARD